MKQEAKPTVDFGAPSEFGAHHFYVEIPATPRDAVKICEDYGISDDDKADKWHVILDRKLWNKIKNDVRLNFNARLKESKDSTGSWKVGKVKIDKFLGRELCVLAWALSCSVSINQEKYGKDLITKWDLGYAIDNESSLICKAWLALRPEERWWFFTKIIASGGHHACRNGWGKAVYYALTDGN